MGDPRRFYPVETPLGLLTVVLSLVGLVAVTLLAMMAHTVMATVSI